MNARLGELDALDEPTLVCGWKKDEYDRPRVKGVGRRLVAEPSGRSELELGELLGAAWARTL